MGILRANKQWKGTSEPNSKIIDSRVLTLLSMVKQYLQLQAFLSMVKLYAGCYNTAFWQGSLNGPCLYLQVLSDSGMDRTLPQKWPEERGETALSSPSASVYALDQTPEIILNIDNINGLYYLCSKQGVALWRMEAGLEMPPACKTSPLPCTLHSTTPIQTFWYSDSLASKTLFYV